MGGPGRQEERVLEVWLARSNHIYLDTKDWCAHL